MTFKEYYLYNDLIGLSKVEKNKEITTVKELLYHYQIEKEFIAHLPDNFYFEDISLIMLNYRHWIYNRWAPEQTQTIDKELLN